MSISLLHINIFALECSWRKFATASVAKDEGNQIGESHQYKTPQMCQDLCNLTDGCQSFRICNLLTSEDMNGNKYGYYTVKGDECYLFDKVLGGNEATTKKVRFYEGFRFDVNGNWDTKYADNTPITDECNTYYRDCGNNINT